MNLQTSILHYIYVAVMITGSTIVFFMSRDRKLVPKTEFFISFIIPIWSAISYLSIAIGQGMLEVDSQITYYARYIDWIVTTPLLLLSLSFVAMYTIKKDLIIIFSLVFADIVMVVSGLVADLSEGYNRFIWFFIGMLGFMVSLYIIWLPLKKLAMSQSEQLDKIYTLLAGYLTIFWIGYPTTWILGPSGLSIVSQTVDTYLFIILPMFSKVGFSILTLVQLKKSNIKSYEKLS